MYGKEYAKKIGIKLNDFNQVINLNQVTALCESAPRVWVCCIGADFDSISDGRAIQPTQVQPIPNPRILKSYNTNACPVLLAKIKKDGTCAATGITAYGSNCKTNGDAVQIFDTYDECIEFWNKRIDEVIEIKRQAINALNLQINDFSNAKL